MRIFKILLYIFIIVGFSNWLIAQEKHKDFSGQFRKYKKGDNFIIVVVPEKNVYEERKRYEGIAKYLSRKLELDVHIEILPGYGDICATFLNNKADAGFFGSFSYVLTHVKANVEAIVRPVMKDGTSGYNGYIFVRKDSKIKTVDDMKGKRLSLVSKVTTAGYIFQLDYLRKNGITVPLEDYFSKVYFTGSHDASAWSVYIKETDVGGCKNHIFNAIVEENKDFKEQMVVLAESEELPSNGLAVRQDMSPVYKEKLKNLLLDIDKTEEGKQILENLGAIKFIETSDKDYDALYKMVERLNIDLKTYSYEE